MKTISLNHITKIEGHAALKIKLKKGKVQKCELSSIEGARYFEDLLLGRHYSEAFEISSRICGICSSGHVVCAITAIENALNIKATPQTFAFRQLLTLGERIRSHATHLYFLALPDYLGYESALAMLPKYKKEISNALSLMKLGNLLVKTIGGRDLHPVSATVGGFVGLPTQKELNICLKSITKNLILAQKTVKIFQKLKNPNFARPLETFSLSFPEEYGMLRGFLKSEHSCFNQADYQNFFKEHTKYYSTAKVVTKKGKSFRMGALSRLNNNANQLNPLAKKLLGKSKLKIPCFNPFLNNFAQTIELVHSLEEARKNIINLDIKKENLKKPHKSSGHGIAAIEVPRGTLWHEYEVDKKGKITKANIITPTTQNLYSMQEDIRHFLPQILDLPHDKIVLEIEKLIRAYDPCFSCSTHFLKVKWCK